MKTHSITKIAAMSLLLLGLLACRKEKPHPHPKPEPEAPEYIDGMRVVADYYGDVYECGYDDYAIYFQLGETDDEGRFVREGIELSLDILVAKGGPTFFPAGKYYLTDGSYRSAGILPSIPTTLKEYLIRKGMSLDGYTAADLASVVYGYTSFYVQTSKEKCWLGPVDGAELEVTVNGAEYIFEIRFKSDGDSFTYKYKGPLTIVDRTEVQPDEVYTIEGVNRVMAYNDGHVFGSTTDDWFIQLENDKDEYVNIEFLAPSGYDTLPQGTFTVPADFFEVEKTLSAWTLCPLYKDEERWYGTYYAQGETVVFGATEGTLNISTSDGVSMVALSFFDAENNAQFEVEYIGSVPVDESSYVTSTKSMVQRPAAGRKSPARMLNTRKLRPGSGVRRMVR